MTTYERAAYRDGMMAAATICEAVSNTHVDHVEGKEDRRIGALTCQYEIIRAIRAAQPNEPKRAPLTILPIRNSHLVAPKP